ncbi:MAG: sulfur transferase domain-containing protein [Leptolyngbyaceae cyanobacterium MO_188.B28]|nr:sulfur transferase domain-containing protein [Leptolyngbyaceae cyanobacterium MO_188.B28]
MEPIRKINDELAIAGQILPEQLKQLADQGYRSVLNLRSPDEKGFSSNEQQQAEAFGLYYANVPAQMEQIDGESATFVLQCINELPKPELVHCGNGALAAAMVLMHIAIRQGATMNQAFERIEQLGIFKHYGR